MAGKAQLPAQPWASGRRCTGLTFAAILQYSRVDNPTLLRQYLTILVRPRTIAPSAAQRKASNEYFRGTKRKDMKQLLIRFAAIVQVAVWSPALFAAITYDAPFTGDAFESWEEFSLGQTTSPLTIFGGAATISGSGQTIWQTTSTVGGPGGFGIAFMGSLDSPAFRDAVAFDGTQGYGTIGGGTITFSSPVSDFGGYWASATYWFSTPAVSFTFYDSQGLSIGTADPIYDLPDYNGTLEWWGWHSSEPIYSITYSGTAVANDSLRYTLAPEPSSCALLCPRSPDHLRPAPTPKVNV